MAVSVKAIAHKIVLAMKQTKDVVKNANVELTLLLSVKIRQKYCFKSSICVHIAALTLQYMYTHM